jgi:hypothetical protein
MSVFRPVLSLSLDGQSFTGPEAAVLALRCELSIGESHDRLTVHATAKSPLAAAEADGELTLSLGYDDAPSGVFTGKVTNIEFQPWGISLEAVAPTLALAHLRAAAAYVDQSIGDIISDLASMASVSVGAVDATDSLAAYHVDEQRTAWAHVLSLASFGGYAVTSDASGALEVTTPKSAPAAHNFRYGAELLAWRVGPARAQAPLEGLPHGAASELGNAKWHVLMKQPAKSGARAARVLGLARTKELADKFSAAEKSRAGRNALLARAVVIGAAELRAGQPIELVDLPGQGSLILRSTYVCHDWHYESGFLSRLLLAGVA